MAQKVQVILIDDLDGGEATETVRFGLDQFTYDIDLSDAHAKELREALDVYVSKARKAGNASRAGGRRTSSPTRSSSTRLAKIREWAKANGYSIGDRGRVSKDIVEAYEAAN